MGIIGASDSGHSMDDWRGLQATAVQAQASIEIAGARLSQIDAATLDLIGVPRDLMPDPGQTLIERAREHLQQITAHVGAFTGDNIAQQLREARSELVEQARQGRRDDMLAARVRLLRELKEDEDYGVRNYAKAYGEFHFDEVEGRLQALKEVLSDLQGFLSAYDQLEHGTVSAAGEQ